ncbi:nuclear pore complex protein-like protein Nup107 [Plenodomus tracheiphilus IPT5]|uniref:Nuclear pore complex protein n=1 Tax=Plenodomus tracheiphilus IPT5 TaxID=1408161 RepID=A0A6A7BK62_9PLEO|nr:nuclear pore complex protein-like protein Nup107 [Plenodomus tracheiphilus IPT5]
MASLSFARQSQPTAARSGSGSAPIFGTSRAMNNATPNDPLQPLRAMADRVGKEVEKFAERVDHWHTHGIDTKKAKHQTTVKMVAKFRDLAESHVKELKKAHAAEHKNVQNHSVRRRIQSMADAADDAEQSSFSQQGHSLAMPNITNGAHDSENLQELREWQAELATWELVRLIIDHYHSEPGTNPNEEKRARLAEVGGTDPFCPNSEIWDRFLLEDEQAKEKALVLRWLEQTAENSESDIESITAQLQEVSGKGVHTWTSGWLDTKTKIKQVKRLEDSDKPLSQDMNLKTSDRITGLVTQLDPDAPTRQKRSLEKPDEYYERALWMVCYEMMRRGKPWKEIVDWCQERNEGWRGVSLGATAETRPKGGPNVAGPTVGYLFRRMCFHTARGARIPYEAAVYGLLGGDLKQVQAVSRSWDDHLYAHYNALLLSRFDAYLPHKYPSRVSQSLTSKFVFQDAVANIGDWKKSAQTVIGLLKQQKVTAAQAVLPMKLIQGALISRDIDELMLKTGVALADMMQDDDRQQSLIIHPDSSKAERGAKPVGETRTFTAEKWYQTLASDPHAFRVSVHIAIIFRNGIVAVGTTDEQRWLAWDNIIAAYIEFLRISKRIQLIPLYAAQLGHERGAHCLARVLPDIKNSDEQRRCVALLESYRIDVITVVSQAFTFAFRNSGFTHFDDEGYTVITKPIKRFEIVERVTTPQEQILWPGQRIKREFEGHAIEEKEEAIIEALQWYQYIGSDYEQTFWHLRNALTIFLLNGRIGAAEKVINDLSVETLSLSRTEALCGYPFDFTIPGAEEQDERQLYDHRDTLTDITRATALPMDQIPTAEKHREIVEDLRKQSAPYYDLQQIVRLLVLFREWREVEENLIKVRNDRARDPSAPPRKPDTQRTKEILDAISSVFDMLIVSISTSTEPATHDANNLKYAYMPDIVLAYLSVLQTSSYFLQREPAVKAMEIAVLVADEENKWLQKVLLRTGRMSELVDCLASVSKAMLRLGEFEKKGGKVKRGGRGETLRVWDLGTRERS